MSLRVVKTVSSVTTSPPIRVNSHGNGGFSLAIGVDLNPGVLTYSVQHTFDAPEDFTSATDYNTNATWRDTTGLAALSATDEGNIAFPIESVRLNVTAFTSGSAEITVIQAD